MVVMAVAEHDSKSEHGGVYVLEALEFSDEGQLETEAVGG